MSPIIQCKRSDSKNILLISRQLKANIPFNQSLLFAIALLCMP